MIFLQIANPVRRYGNYLLLIQLAEFDGIAQQVHDWRSRIISREFELVEGDRKFQFVMPGNNIAKNACCAVVERSQ
jgi:hypothetical protein